MAVATDKGACNGLKRFDLLMSWRDGTKVCDLVCVEVHANKARRPGHALLDAYGSPEHAVEAASRQARVDAEFTHRSEEHTSELQSLMRISYAVFCLKKKTTFNHKLTNTYTTPRIYEYIINISKLTS